MWITCFSLSIACLVLFAILSFVFNKSKFANKYRLSIFHFWLAGVFLSAILSVTFGADEP